MRTIVRLGFDETGLLHVAVCSTGSCGWRSAAHVVKAGATEEAGWHRSQHRRWRDLAASSIQHGWFKHSETSASERCPSCRLHVFTTFAAATTDREIQRLLVDAVEEHLMTDCREGRR